MMVVVVTMPVVVVLLVVPMTMTMMTVVVRVAVRIIHLMGTAARHVTGVRRRARVSVGQRSVVVPRWIKINKYRENEITYFRNERQNCKIF